MLVEDHYNCLRPLQLPWSQPLHHCNHSCRPAWTTHYYHHYSCNEQPIVNWTTHYGGWTILANNLPSLQPFLPRSWPWTRSKTPPLWSPNSRHWEPKRHQGPNSLAQQRSSWKIHHFLGGILWELEATPSDEISLNGRVDESEVCITGRPTISGIDSPLWQIAQAMESHQKIKKGMTKAKCMGFLWPIIAAAVPNIGPSNYPTFQHWPSRQWLVGKLYAVLTHLQQ